MASSESLGNGSYTKDFEGEGRLPCNQCCQRQKALKGAKPVKCPRV